MCMYVYIPTYIYIYVYILIKIHIYQQTLFVGFCVCVCAPQKIAPRASKIEGSLLLESHVLYTHQVSQGLGRVLYSTHVTFHPRCVHTILLDCQTILSPKACLLTLAGVRVSTLFPLAGVRISTLFHADPLFLQVRYFVQRRLGRCCLRQARSP